MAYPILGGEVLETLDKRLEICFNYYIEHLFYATYVLNVSNSDYERSIPMTRKALIKDGKTINAIISEGSIAKMEVIAKEKFVTRSWIIRDAIREYILKHDTN